MSGKVVYNSPFSLYIEDFKKSSMYGVEFVSSLELFILSLRESSRSVFVLSIDKLLPSVLMK